MKIEIEIPEIEITDYLVALDYAGQGKPLDEEDAARLGNLKKQIQKSYKNKIEKRLRA